MLEKSVVESKNLEKKALRQAQGKKEKKGVFSDLMSAGTG